MGYFSNGTEGMDYQDQYCCRCKHDANEDCPIWSMHLAYAYVAEGVAKDILDALIPPHESGCGNKQCRFFEPVQLQLLDRGGVPACSPSDGLPKEGR